MTLRDGLLRSGGSSPTTSTTPERRQAAGALLLIAVWAGSPQGGSGRRCRVPQHRRARGRSCPLPAVRELTMLIMGSGLEVLFPFASARTSSSARATSSPPPFAWGGRPAPCQRGHLHRRRGRRQLALLEPPDPMRPATGRILGVEFFDKVYLADRIAGVVRPGGFVLWVWRSASPSGRSSGTAATCGRAEQSEAPGDRGASSAGRPHPRQEMWR